MDDAGAGEPIPDALPKVVTVAALLGAQVDAGVNCITHGLLFGNRRRRDALTAREYRNCFLERLSFRGYRKALYGPVSGPDYDWHFVVIDGRGDEAWNLNAYYPGEFSLTYC
jgi:hypothetical protein